MMEEGMDRRRQDQYEGMENKEEKQTGQRNKSINLSIFFFLHNFIYLEEPQRDFGKLGKGIKDIFKI